jgi:hypothetical protein
VKLFWRMGHRWNEARFRRALRQGDVDRAFAFKQRSEKFYRMIKGGV